LILAAIFLTMLAASFLAPHGYEQQFRREIASAPSRTHPLGTDALGRDRLSRLLYGGRVSILLAPAASVVSVLLALIVGAGAALAGDLAQRSVNALIDLALSLPWLFLLLAVRAMLPLNLPPLYSIVVTFALLGVLGWPGPARVLLAAARRQLGSDYILFARASGSFGWRLAARQLAPNLGPVVLAQLWTTAPAYLLAEANLSLLGLGVSEPLPSWGNLLRELQNITALQHQPWVAVPLLLLVAALTCCQLAQPDREFSI
jgi:ABC-type dipeptide/oligopeptide/nickel transport system permease subunit